MNRNWAMGIGGWALCCNFALAASNQAADQGMAEPQAAEGQQESVTDLSAVTVKGKFVDTGASSATKLDVSVLDTPFSVSAYTDAFMQAIETTNVGDLYKYMAGVQRAGQTAYDISLRGFKAGVEDRNVIMVDGLPGLTGRLGSPATFGADRIEVVRGPASVLYGQAQPGGFVNIITKKPLEYARQEFGAKLTSFAGDKLDLGDSMGYAVSADTTGPVNDSQSVLYRFVVEKSEDLDAFRDHAFGKRLYVAPKVTWKLTDATTAIVGAEYSEVRNAYDRGLVLPNGDIDLIAPITTSYQEPGDFQKESGTAFTLDLTHDFGNDAKFRFNARRATNEDASRGYQQNAIRPDLRTLARQAVGLNNRRTLTFFDANFIVPFGTGSLEHRIVTGINGGREDAWTGRSQFFTGPATGPNSLDIDIYQPIYGRVRSRDELPQFTNPTVRLERDTISDSYGIYAYDLITLSERWKMNVGLRWAYEKQLISNIYPTASSREKKTDKPLPLLGLLYQPNRDWTVYGSYSTSYVPVPSNVFDVDGNNPFVPQSADQIEVGAKTELMGGRVQATLAAFRINKQNVLNTFACPLGTCSQQIGEERSQGLEFEVNARPTDQLQFNLGIAHTDAEVTEARDLATVGARLQNTARNTASLWSRYDFRDGLLDGFGIGLGLAYVGERAGSLPTTASPRVIRLPSYSVADLGFYYTRGNLDWTLKVSNLTDETYYESSGSLGTLQILAGQPRKVTLSVRANF